MAKTAKKSPARKGQRPAPRLGAALRGGDHPHADDQVCACDFKYSAALATADKDLPAARGGVEAPSRARRSA